MKMFASRKNAGRFIFVENNNQGKRCLGWEWEAVLVTTYK